MKFSGDPDDYLPQVLTRWEGTELFNYSPFIYSYQAVNVALTGEGVLDGNNGEGFANWRPMQHEAKMRLREMGGRQLPVYERVFGQGDFLRSSERIVFWNNYMEGHNALAIGSEISGGVRNVFMENNTLGDVRGSLYFKSNKDRIQYLFEHRLSDKYNFRIFTHVVFCFRKNKSTS